MDGLSQPILFVTSTRIGDAVLSSGILSHLVETRPEARFTIACGAVSASLFAGVPRLDRVIAVTKSRYAGHWLRLWAECVGTRWDTVVDLRRSGLVWTLCAKHRHRLSGPAGVGHRVVEAARVLGVEPPPAPRLWTLPRHDARGAELIPAGGPVLAVGPSANWSGKTWAADRFVELVRRLIAPGAPFAGARVAVFAAASERASADPVLAAVPEAQRLPVIGEAELLSVYAALGRCAFYVGNDSGLMHLAAAAGVPTLGLFGPSRDDLYAPWGEACAVVRTPESFDELAALRTVPGYADESLMGNLPVDAVEAAALDLMRRQPPGDRPVGA